jgi:hypothetical protein
MLMTRMFAMAMAAIGLSLGGFELGAKRVEMLPTSPPVDVPADHPLSVALQPAVAQGMSTPDRNRLVQMAAELERARAAARESAKLLSAERARQTRGRAFETYARLLFQDKTKPIPSYLKQTGPIDAITQAELSRLKKDEARQRAELLDARNRLAEAQRETEKQLTDQSVAKVDRQFSDMALQQMTPKIQNQVRAAVRTRRDMDEERGFGLLIALRNRDDLNLTAHQVTQLQLLQAEFIRGFAPIRETYETRVDSVKWQWKDNKIEGAESIAPEKVRSQYFVQYVTDLKAKNNPVAVSTSSTKYKVDLATSKRVTTTKYRVALDKAQIVRFYVSNSPPKVQATNKDLLIRYFVWTSDDDLQRQLSSLKKEIDGRVMKELNESQRKNLQEMINRSLVISK